MEPWRGKGAVGWLAGLGLCLAVAGPGGDARAALFAVDTTLDGVDASPGDGTCAAAAGGCTLRAAIGEANALPGVDAITLPAGTYALTLGPGGGGNDSGALQIGEAVHLVGAGSSCTAGSILTLGGSLEGGLLESLVPPTGLPRGVRPRIQGVCLTGATNPSPFDQPVLRNTGPLDLVDVRIEGNQGPALVSSGVLRYRGGAIRDNDAVLDPGSGETLAGGGIRNESGGVLTLHALEIADNDGGSDAASAPIGAIANHGTLLVHNSGIFGNTARCGAVVESSGYLAASNVSIDQNDAFDDCSLPPASSGVLESTGDRLLLVHVTVGGANNAQPNTPGAALRSGGGLLRVRNSIVMADCDGVGSQGHNVESGASCGFTDPGDQQNTVVPLVPNASGPTTALVPTSGIHVQDLADAVRCPHLDQRGHRRPQGGACDRGAVELGSGFACANGLDDDGDGRCDTAGATCSDGSLAGDAGCTGPEDPQELVLSAGDLLVTDRDASIRRIDPDDGDSRILTRGLGLQGAYAVTEDRGRVFEAEGDRLFEIDGDGLPWLVLAGLSLEPLRGVAPDGEGFLWVASEGSGQVLRVDPESGAVSAAWPGPLFAGVEFAAVDPGDGTLLVSDFDDATPQGIHRLDTGTGAVLESWTGAPFDQPRQHALDPDGETLWVADSGADRLFALDLGAPVGPGNPLEVGGDLGRAWGVVLDGDDALVAARDEGEILRVALDGSSVVLVNGADVARPHEIARVPEPGSALLLGAGVLAVAALAARRRAQPAG